MSSRVVQAFGEGVWTVDGDRVRMFTIPFETRMTVVRLASGGLWLHSPVAPTEERVAGVRALGNVEHVVAPNRFHHVHFQSFCRLFPNAETWGAPGLSRRRSDLEFSGTLGDEAPPAWRDDLTQLVFGGSRILSEVVFFHPRSRSLIVTDIVQNHDPSLDSWFWRSIKRWNGIQAPNGGAPRDWRLTVWNHRAARRSRDIMLGWDFDRVILAHGNCVTEDARGFVERAFAWLG